MVLAWEWIRRCHSTVWCRIQVPLQPYACNFYIIDSYIYNLLSSTSPAHCSYALLDPYLGVPDIFTECINYLQLFLDFPSLFRGIPDGEVLALRLSFEMERSIPKGTSPHAVTALLITLLRNYPEPLLTYERFDAFLACRLIEEEVDQIRNVKLLLHDLPAFHKPSLLALMSFLNEVSRHADKNGIQSILLCGFTSL